MLPPLISQTQVKKVLEMDSPKAARPVVAKPPVPVSALGVACVVNTFMTACALFDYSATIYATSAIQSDAAGENAERLRFLADYYAWRGAAPIISNLLLVLLVPLPFVLFGFLRDTLAALLGLRRATTLRHAADVTQTALLLCVLLPVVFLCLVPAQDAYVLECTGASLIGGGPLRWRARAAARSQCSSHASALCQFHLTLVLLNLAMLLCDVAKYVGNVEEAKQKTR